MEERVFFIHNSYTWHREPFFVELSKICNIKFFFTKLWKNGYQEIEYDCCQIKNLQYEVVQNTFHIAWPVFGYLLKDEYDTVLITVMDNWHQTFEAFVSAVIARLRRKRVIYFWERWDKGWLFCEKRNWKMHHISFLRYLWRVGRFYVKRVEFRILKYLVDGFIPVGQYSKEYFKSCGVKESRMYMAHDASEIFYNTIRTRKEMKISENRIMILFMARVVKLKGIDQLLEAYARLEKEHLNIELYICGDGAYLQDAKEKADKLQIEHIVWAGSIRPEDRKDYYANCDIFVLPNWEPDIWGLSVNEAMQFAKPVVISDLTGCGPDLVKTGRDQNGFIVKSGDSGELCEALRQLILDDTFRLNAGKHSARIIQRYTYKRMALDFKRAFEGKNVS